MAFKRVSTWLAWLHLRNPLYSEEELLYEGDSTFKKMFYWLLAKVFVSCIQNRVMLIKLQMAHNLFVK